MAPPQSPPVDLETSTPLSTSSDSELDAFTPPGVLRGDATVSAPTLGFQVWAGSHHVKVMALLLAHGNVFCNSMIYDSHQGWRNELKPEGATFEFSFTMLSRRRFAPPRSHPFTGAFRARNIMTIIQLI